MLFSEVCHFAEGVMVCPKDAVTETEYELGHVEIGIHHQVNVVTGILKYRGGLRHCSYKSAKKGRISKKRE